MYRKIFLLFPLVLLLLVVLTQMNGSTHSALDLNAKEGKLDLRMADLQHIGPIDINGEWAFYWNELLQPDELGASSPFVEVPNAWRHYEMDGDNLPQHGYATYRLKILLNEEDIGKMLSLYIPSMATAYRVWANDQMILSNGIVGKTRQEMVPKNYAKTAHFSIDRPELEFVIQVSNFHQRKSGIWEPLRFGTAEQITKLRERNVIIQVFTIGCIFIIGFYHLALFYQRRQDVSPLLLALVCFCIAFRTSILKDAILIYLFPNISWEVTTSLEYLLALSALLLFVLFLQREYSLEISKMFTRILIGIFITYSLFITFTPASIFTNTIILMQGIIFIAMAYIVFLSLRELKNRRKGAYVHFIGLLILFLAIINDIFYYSEWMTTDEFVSIGLLIYLFAQSIHLAGRFSDSFEKVENLSLQLQQVNLSLENEVHERTKELQAANRSLQKMEQTRRQLLGSVSHELKTPLTFIQGYIKAMMDGVVSKDDSTYLRAVYSDTEMMAHMIHDLQDLSQLESGQMTFHFEQVYIKAFFKDLYEEQKRAIEEKGYHFHYREQGLQQTEDVLCRIDTIRIKQVYMNLLINAQKFTPKGGTITLQIETRKNWNKVVISVIDTGTGIPEKDMPRIFDRFYKVVPSDEDKERGAGLGLAIAKEIVQQHQGSMGAKSEFGKGSVLFFHLPIIGRNEK